MPADATALVAPPKRTRLLSDGRLRILRAAIEAFVHDGESTPPPARLDRVTLDADDYLASTTGTSRIAVWFALTVLQLSPLLAIGRPRLFTGCTIPDRQRCLERLERSRFVAIALLAAAIKAVSAFIWFEHPRSLASTGYDGLCRTGGERPDAPLAERPGEDA